jgi:citrate synthase
MTQLGIGVAALNQTSFFREAYEKGMPKSEYWIHTLEDSVRLIACLPALAARIYRNIYHVERSLPSIDKNMDLAGQNFSEGYPGFMRS